MIFRELSNAFFRFVLRCAGAEIDGNVQTPPSMGSKIQRPIRARVMMTSCDLTVTLTCTYFKHDTLLDCSLAVKKRFGRVWALYCW